jgi:hypothetical protein
MKCLTRLNQCSCDYILSVEWFVGRGVFSLRDLRKGDFLLDYHGTLVTKEPNGIDVYIYKLIHENKQYWYVHVWLQLFVLFVLCLLLFPSIRTLS